MNEKNLLELKSNFRLSVLKHATQHEDHFEQIWGRIVNIHSDRPYHNLSLAWHDLNRARNLKMYIPDFVIVAAVLRYGSFNPYLESNDLEACSWAGTVLRNGFAWRDNDINEVKRMISASAKLTTPTDNSPPEEKLIHDMKMSRFAKEEKDFSKDRENSRLEFSSVNDEQYFRNEHALLMAYYNTSKTFACYPFQIALTDLARNNMYNRLAWVNEVIKRTVSFARQNGPREKIL